MCPAAAGRAPPIQLRRRPSTPRSAPRALGHTTGANESQAGSAVGGGQEGRSEGAGRQPPIFSKISSGVESFMRLHTGTHTCTKPRETLVCLADDSHWRRYVLTSFASFFAPSVMELSVSSRSFDLRHEHARECRVRAQTPGAAFAAAPQRSGGAAYLRLVLTAFFCAVFASSAATLAPAMSALSSSSRPMSTVRASPCLPAASPGAC